MTKNQEKVNVRKAEGPAGPDRQEDSLVPPVDIYEPDENTTVIAAEMPGAKADGIDLRVDKGVLTIAAQADIDAMTGLAGKEFTPTYVDFTGGQYFRAFALGDEVDREKIQAEFRDGLLTVTLPRATQARTRKIEIKG